MTTVDVLKAAKALIEDPERWTKGTLALSWIGTVVDPTSIWARRFCAIGALRRIERGQYYREARDYLWGASRQLFTHEPHITNDCRGHVAVMQMYDKAIEMAEAQQ